MIKKNEKGFKVGDMVVYPKHGVGEIKLISTMEINKMRWKMKVKVNK